jgi:hypothetical protein
MAANFRRGDVAARLDGREMKLRLTLGALAELEAAFAVEDLGALVARFSSGKLSAGDMAKIIGAGLRGAGAAVSDEEVGCMHCDGGAAGFAQIVSELLTRTFGRPEDAPANP